MGGDFAPVHCRRSRSGCEGIRNQGPPRRDEDQVSKELSKYATSKLPIFIHHAPHVVAMHDSPSNVIRKMKDTSIKVAVDLAMQGEASGLVSAGNSGAAMALAMYIFRKLEGVDRPAIATVHPTPKALLSSSIRAGMWTVKLSISSSSPLWGMPTLNTSWVSNNRGLVF